MSDIPLVSLYFRLPAGYPSREFPEVEIKAPGLAHSARDDLRQGIRTHTRREGEREREREREEEEEEEEEAGKTAAVAAVAMPSRIDSGVHSQFSESPRTSCVQVCKMRPARSPREPPLTAIFVSIVFSCLFLST